MLKHVLSKSYYFCFWGEWGNTALATTHLSNAHLNSKLFKIYRALRAGSNFKLYININLTKVK